MIRHSNYKYLPYIGPEKFIFLRSCSNDVRFSDALAAELIKENFRVFYDCCDTSIEALPEDIAAGILNCDKAIFILDKEACEDLDMRNSINYALKEKKDVYIIRDTGFTPTHGLDMQLANVPVIAKGSVSDIIRQMEEKKILKDEFKGEGLRFREDDSRKRLSLIVLGVVLLLALIAAVIFIRNRQIYVNSAEYLLKDVDGSEYLDITMFDEEALKVLKGKTIGTLYMDGMDIRDISAIRDINVREVIISHNPNVSTLYYLCECKGIESVTVSMDMNRFIRDLLNADIEVKVVR